MYLILTTLELKQSGFLVTGRITVSKPATIAALLGSVTPYLLRLNHPWLRFYPNQRLHFCWSLWTPKEQFGSASQTFMGDTLVSVTLDIALRKPPALTEAINSTEVSGLQMELPLWP